MNCIKLIKLDISSEIEFIVDFTFVKVLVSVSVSSQSFDDNVSVLYRRVSGASQVYSAIHARHTHTHLLLSAEYIVNFNISLR